MREGDGGRVTEKGEKGRRARESELERMRLRWRNRE